MVNGFSKLISGQTNDSKLPRILVESRTSCQIPIIVFSETEESIGKREILNAGADDFLLKPLNFQQLETVIEKQIDNRNITFGGLL